MNALRIATQGLRGGRVSLAIASQGFQPLGADFIYSSGGGGISAHRLRLLREDEELIAILAGAAGLLN